MAEKLLSLSQTANILNVSPETLRNWDDNGTLVAIRTRGNHRRYRQSDIDKFMGVEALEDKRENLPVVTYARVSSNEQKQKGDLDRQSQRLSEYCAKKKLKVDHIIKDVGSGLSDSRAGLNKLFNLVIDHKISQVIIEHKDRLTRFQFNVFVKFFNSHNVEIVCADKTAKNDEAELVEDVMMLMAVFSGKIHGKRSAQRRREKKLQQDLANGKT